MVEIPEFSPNLTPLILCLPQKELSEDQIIWLKGPKDALGGNSSPGDLGQSIAALMKAEACDALLELTKPGGVVLNLGLYDGFVAMTKLLASPEQTGLTRTKRIAKMLRDPNLADINRQGAKQAVKRFFLIRTQAIKNGAIPD
jgi:hypothetical protein